MFCGRRGRGAAERRRRRRLGSGLGAQPPRVERAQVGREELRGNRQRGFSVGAHGRWARVIAIDSGLHLQGAQDRVAAQDRVVAQDSLWLAVSWGDGEGHSRLGGQGVRHRGDSSEGARCVRERRTYAGWAATAWHPRAGPRPIRATRRARVARRRGRVVQRHRAEAKGAVGRGEAATEGSASGPPGVSAPL